MLFNNKPNTIVSSRRLFNVLLYTGVRLINIFYFFNTIGRSLQEKINTHDSFVHSSSLTFQTAHFFFFFPLKEKNPFVRRPHLVIDHKNGQQYSYIAGVSNHVLGQTRNNYNIIYIDPRANKIKIVFFKFFFFLSSAIKRPPQLRVCRLCLSDGPYGENVFA